MTQTKLADMDTARAMEYTLRELRIIQGQVRLSIHYAECILNNPAIDHSIVRAKVGESVLHEMAMVGLGREAVGVCLTLEGVAKSGRPQ